MRLFVAHEVGRTAALVALWVVAASCGLRQLPSQDYATIERRTQPEQPDSGPGGKDYKHNNVLLISKDKKADGFALFHS